MEQRGHQAATPPPRSAATSLALDTRPAPATDCKRSAFATSALPSALPSVLLSALLSPADSHGLVFAHSGDEPDRKSKWLRNTQCQSSLGSTNQRVSRCRSHTPQTNHGRNTALQKRVDGSVRLTPLYQHAGLMGQRSTNSQAEVPRKLQIVSRIFGHSPWTPLDADASSAKRSTMSIWL